MLHGSVRPLGLDAQSSYVTLLSSAASHYLLRVTRQSTFLSLPQYH